MTCSTCKHYVQHLSQQSAGECHWASSFTIPEQPFWALSNFGGPVFVRPAQEGCKAHTVVIVGEVAE